MNPVLLELGPFQVRYYGLLMAFAIILGYFISLKIARERKIKGIDEESLQDFLIYFIIGAIIGARLFHVLVYNPSFYLSNPIEILKIWKGGLASHGGIIGAAIITILFCRKRKLHFYDLADIVAVPFALGAVFIRLGNFTNGELVGRITDVPWAMRFEGYEGLRHPSQLYEAAKNLMLFIILWNMRKLKLPRGMMFWSAVGLFSLFRFFVEFYKDFPLYFGLTMGQLISIPLAGLSAYMIFSISKKEKK